MLFSIVNNPTISASELNHDLEIIRQWAIQWKLQFNPDPTKQATEMLFSCKKTPTNHPDIIFNNTIVEKVEEQKHLGLVLHSSLSFEKHINEKIIKAKKKINIIKNVSKYLPIKEVHDLMYKAFVRPYFDYCDIIYHIPPREIKFVIVLNSLMEKNEKIQYQAGLVITGAWKG